MRILEFFPFNRKNIENTVDFLPFRFYNTKRPTGCVGLLF